MSSKYEEILWKLYMKKLKAERNCEIIQMKFETLQEKQQIDEMKIKKITDQNKLIKNKMILLKEQNEELKKQIQKKSEETETITITDKNTTDIWEAIEKGSLLAVKYYYRDNPENIIIQHSSYSTPIHYASRLGHLHIVEFLLSKGIEVNKTDSKGETPLMCASQGGHLSVVNYLLEKGAEINHRNEDKKTALHMAAVDNHLDIVKLLIEKGAHKVGALPIKYPRDYLPIFEFLLSRGKLVDERDSEGFTPLMRAAEGNHLNIVKLLIDKGFNKVGAFHIASRLGRWPIIKFLLSRVEVDERDSDGFTPLMRAVEGNKLDIVKFLIDKGFNKVGALHIASRHGYLPVIEFLLSRGKLVDERDSEGFTPLMRAAEGNHLDIIELLIDKGADKVGALHIASRHGYLSIIEFLLLSSANVDERDSDGFTPLMWAAEGNRLYIVKLLIDKGANKTLKNKNNHTPFDLVKLAKSTNPSLPNINEILTYLS